MTADPVVAGLARALGQSRHLVVLTGAGISAESGIPTFRDALTGLWSRFRPEQLASPEGFARDPEAVWAWYESRRARVREVSPNAGHHALAAIAARVPRFTLVTQNVDGLHARAGHAEVIEYHGNLFSNRCLDDSGPVDGLPEPCPVPPRCPRCGGPVRPGVVWFGEAIPPEAARRADTAARDCDLFLAIGTSALVYPAAGLADLAAAHGARIAEINPEPTALSGRAEFAIAAPAGRALPALLSAM